MTRSLRYRVHVCAFCGWLLGCASAAEEPASVSLPAPTAQPAPPVGRRPIQRRSAPKPRANEPKVIRAKHILVMHDQSERRPDEVRRRMGDALIRARECLARLRGGANFDEMVAAYSDEPGAADRHGDLGTFEKKDMVAGFAEAAFALEVGEISEIVETPFGYHIIQRTE